MEFFKRYEVALTICIVCMLLAVLIGRLRMPEYVTNTGSFMGSSTVVDSVTEAIGDVGNAGVSIVWGVVRAALKIGWAIFKLLIKLTIVLTVLSAVLTIFGFKGIANTIKKIRHSLWNRK